MKKLLGLLLLFGIVGCKQEPTQLEKCFAANYEKMYEDILLSEEVIEQDRLKQRLLYPNKELADKFWLDAEEVWYGDPSTNYFKEFTDNLSSEVFSADLSLVSLFAMKYQLMLMPFKIERITESDYFFSFIPTINELDNILRITSLYVQSIKEETYPDWYYNEIHNFAIILVDYYSALKEYNMSYYSDSEPLKDIELAAINRTNAEATELCNSQGIY